MALDKLLTFTDYYNQLKTLDDLRKKWLSFMEQLKAVQDNLPEGTYLNAPYNISDSMIQIMSTSLDTVLPSGTNVVKKIYKDLGVIKYNGTLYVGFPNSDLNNYLSGKTSTELNIRRVILLQGNNGCIGCCVRFINEFTPPQFSSGNYDILKCGGDYTSWIYNYRWFEMEALGSLATDGMVDLVSTNNIGISASDPNAIFSPKQQIDVVSSIHSCYGRNIPKEVNFNQTRFCMNNNISSSSFAVKTKPDRTTNGEIIFTASKIGSSFIITVKPRLEEWRWAYRILGLLCRFTLPVYINNAGCDFDCMWKPGEEFFPGDCIEYHPIICGYDPLCEAITHTSTANNLLEYHAVYETNEVTCYRESATTYKKTCGEKRKASLRSSACVSCNPAVNAKFTCAASPPELCTCNNSWIPCDFTRAYSQGVSPGYGCTMRYTRLPPETYSHVECKSTYCSAVDRKKPKETREEYKFMAVGLGGYSLFYQLNALYYLDAFLQIIDNICVHSAISIIKNFNNFLKELAIPASLTRSTPFPSLMSFCTTSNNKTEGVIPVYESWGVVRNLCTYNDADEPNIAEIDSCGLMQVHIGDTITWTFFP